MNEALNATRACTIAYSEGYEAGKQEILLRVQSELHHVALNSRANNNQTKPENLVIMLSDVDKVVNKMLWTDTLERFANNED